MGHIHKILSGCLRKVQFPHGEKMLKSNEQKTKTEHCSFGYCFVKRAFDVIVSVIGLIFTVFFSVLVAVGNNYHGDNCCIIFSQQRIGRNGRPFTLYKFRTMYPESEELLGGLLKNTVYCSEWEKNQKLINDPRVTRNGRFLRSYGLDELPQFFNILKGEMSFIGPRPLVEGELEAHKGDALYYYSVKPGLIGWWVCNRTPQLSYAERLGLEYYYIENQCFTLDIKILLMTVFKRKFFNDEEFRKDDKKTDAHFR